jgi:segregation and condensation protein A
LSTTIEGDGPRPASAPGGPGVPSIGGSGLVDGAADGRCEVGLPQFEGPLDLLLHLVRRHELDILDIPIAFVCEKYLEYLEVMRALDLETAGEYLVMAATLAYLKSRELVPTPAIDPLAPETADEDGQDPRAELIARLLEYQRYRAAATELDRMPVSGRDVFDRGGVVDVEPLDSGLSPITLYRLAEAYHRVLDRARVLKTHEVVIERVSVAARMKQLTSMLLEQSRFDFEKVFTERTWSSEHELRVMLIVTLMSVLELVRLGVARVHQPEGSDALLIERSATAEEAEMALAGYDEAASFGQVVHEPDPVDPEADDGEIGLLDPIDGEDRPLPETSTEPLAAIDAVAQNPIAAPEPIAANGPEPANEPAVANEATAANESSPWASPETAAANNPVTEPAPPDDDDDDGR